MTVALPQTPNPAYYTYAASTAAEIIRRIVLNQRVIQADVQHQALGEILTLLLLALESAKYPHAGPMPVQPTQAANALNMILSFVSASRHWTKDDDDMVNYLEAFVKFLEGLKTPHEFVIGEVATGTALIALLQALREAGENAHYVSVVRDIPDGY